MLIVLEIDIGQRLREQTMRFNADFFRIAFACASTEQTRFYLGGVFVEPSESGGAILTATDGHRLISIHDAAAEFGANEAPAIVRLSPEALKLCRVKRLETRREIVVSGQNATIETVSTQHFTKDAGGPQESREAIGLSPNCLIDGTFPDWRRVLPKECQPTQYPAFASHYLATMAETGVELAKAATHIEHQEVLAGRKKAADAMTLSSPAMRIRAEDAGSPAMVNWLRIPFAFAVLMPMRADGLAVEIGRPGWTMPRRVRNLQAVA